MHSLNQLVIHLFHCLFKNCLSEASFSHHPFYSIIAGDGDILGDSGSSSVNAISRRSDILKYNISSVIMSCEFSNTYSVTWKVFSGRNGSSNKDVNRTDSSLLLSNSIFSFLRNNHELTIPCCQLPYGVLSVSVEIQVSGHALVQGFKANKILNTFISHTTPVAVLERDTFRIYGYNTMVVTFHIYLTIIHHIMKYYTC